MARNRRHKKASTHSDSRVSSTDSTLWPNIYSTADMAQLFLVPADSILLSLFLCIFFFEFLNQIRMFIVFIFLEKYCFM